MAALVHIGITGGIGSGKTLICRIFQRLGVHVYNADDRAKVLMNSDPGLKSQISAEFGSDAYQADGKLDRKHIAKSVFDNPEKLKKLNSLVHPSVGEDYKVWANGFSDQPYILREAALLYEAGVASMLDKVIVVSAPEEIRIKRVLERDSQRTEQEVRAIINSQWKEEEKVKRADYVILNDDEHMVIPQVLKLHKGLLSLRK